MTSPVIQDFRELNIGEWFTTLQDHQEWQKIGASRAAAYPPGSTQHHAFLDEAQVFVHDPQRVWVAEIIVSDCTRRPLGVWQHGEVFEAWCRKQWPGCLFHRRMGQKYDTTECQHEGGLVARAVRLPICQQEMIDNA